MRPRILLTLTFLCAGLPILPAQTPVPQQSAVPRQTPLVPLDLTHLHGTRFLDSTWLVQAGDNPEWAAPGFDDSHWVRFDPYSPINAIYGQQHPDILWYRLHLTVDPTQKDFALSEVQIARAFEVYVNGERIMASGQVDPFHPYTLLAHLLAPIPENVLQTGSLVIALRVRLSSLDWGVGQNPGYYGNNLTAGSYAALQHENWLAVIGGSTLDWVGRLLSIGLGLIALVLFASQRRQSEYLWIAALGALTLIELPVPFVAAFRNIPQFWDILGRVPRIASPFLWAGFYFAFVGQRIGWRWRVFLMIAGVGNVVAALQGLVFNNPPALQFLINLPYIFLLSVIVPIVLALHWRRGNREAPILLVPAALFSLYIYAEVALNALFGFPAWRNFALRGLVYIDRYPVGPFTVSLNPISEILCSTSMAVIILLRSSTMSRRQALFESEFEAAQQVQQVLVPEQIDAVPGFAVESVYLPAQQVGGDFFQIVPDGSGGLLVVVGDVAGKGLPAAMLVSVLVGAIRATAEFTCDPAKLLANLNDRLVGRAGGGFSTALVAHIADDGWVTIANAGHLSPYLDGREVELPGALPLGVAPGIDYELTTFAFEPGSRLTFYSDGVVEAQDSGGELLGFERSRELSVQSATDIAAAARNFGQQDDITVLTIARTAVPVPV